MEDGLLLPHLMGINTRHIPEFKIDRPSDPSGMALIMCFRSPASILTASGMETAKPGDCIVHPPRSRQLHHGVPGAKEGFRNDWLHVGSRLASATMRRLGLPWNKLLRTGRPEILEPHIRRLMAELNSGDEFSSKAVENSLFDMLLEVLRAERESRRKQETMTASERKRFEKMKEMREKALARFKEPQSVATLAKEAGLSPERFSALYKKFFGNSPMADLIDARMLAAKRLLGYSSATLKEAAEECGISDLHYFSRLFKLKVGCAPGRYRASRLRLKP